MKTVRFTNKFPSISRPIYAEVQDMNGQIVHYNAFQTREEMENYYRRLFYNETVMFKRMR